MLVREVNELYFKRHFLSSEEQDGGFIFIQYMCNSLVKEREREREREINLLVQGIRDVEGPMKNVRLN